MSDTMRFPWEDPSVFMFKVWVGQPEFAWARQAWTALERRGLTLFSDELERTKVLIRAMTLGTIYREFCGLAYKEEWDPDYLIWGEEMDLSPFRVAQLVGTNPECNINDKASESRLLDSALYFLIDEERDGICKALCEEFGGESMLFVSLWNSVHRQNIHGFVIDDDEHVPDSPEDILNSDITGEKSDAFSWISNGMQRVR